MPAEMNIMSSLPHAPNIPSANSQVLGRMSRIWNILSQSIFFCISGHVLVLSKYLVTSICTDPRDYLSNLYFESLNSVLILNDISYLDNPRVYMYIYEISYISTYHMYVYTYVYLSLSLCRSLYMNGWIIYQKQRFNTYQDLKCIKDNSTFFQF